MLNSIRHPSDLKWKTLNNIMKYLIIFPLLFISLGIYSQEDTKKSYQKEYDSFNTEIINDFNDFKKKNDSVFLKFLDDSWQEFELFKSEKRPKLKPSQQPQISKELLPEKNKTEDVPERNNIREELNNSGGKAKQMLPPDKINFYGTYINKLTDSPKKVKTNIASKEGIYNFFEIFSENENTNQYIRHIKEKAEKLELNDWGFISLLKKAAAASFKNTNEQKLFLWYALLINAYDVRTGFDGNNIYLLYNTDYKLFNTSFFTLDNQRYYIIKFKDDPDDVSLLFAHQANYVNTPAKVSLFIEKLPKFDKKISSKNFTFRGITFPIDINQNLIDFYNDYPETDLAVYFSTPMSPEASLSLNNFFSGILQGKTERQIVDILLEYIQSSIKYETDEMQFGNERYLFADETLFYPYADCEDRAVLLASLIKQFTGLPVIGLDYPQHISLAVAIPETFEGFYITYSDKKYYICDPTYIGAKSGICMKSLKDIKPKVIDYEK